MKSNHQILDAFLDIQRDTMFSRSIPLDFARITHSEADPSPFWNYALTDTSLNEKEVALIEEKLASLNRKSMIYFESRQELDPLKDVLLSKGYRFHNQDSWMFYKGDKQLDAPAFSSVKRVGNEHDLDLWIKTIDQCYVLNDPQNPYGKLGLYLDLARKAWLANNSEGKFEYYLAYKGDVPVAVATLTFKDGLGYISNVGSLQSVRGEGYGKLITMYCVYRAQQMDCKEIFLGTEEGTYPNEFYKRLGFKTRFTAMGYVKE